jgi:hypothetical protein
MKSFWYLQAQIRQLEKAKSMGVLNPGALGLLGTSSLVTGSDIELETQVMIRLKEIKLRVTVSHTVSFKEV